MEEANKLLGPIGDRLTAAQAVLAKLRNVRDQLVDLRIIWGEKILDPQCKDYAEYERYREEFTQTESSLNRVTEEIAQLGCEVKDVEIGLVDFHAARGEELVFLCWRKGEKEIRYWHPLSDGYASRQPLATF